MGTISEYACKKCSSSFTIKDSATWQYNGRCEKCGMTYDTPYLEEVTKNCQCGGKWGKFENIKCPCGNLNVEFIGVDIWLD